jgi:hypothetical protein
VCTGCGVTRNFSLRATLVALEVIFFGRSRCAHHPFRLSFWFQLVPVPVRLLKVPLLTRIYIRHSHILEPLEPTLTGKDLFWNQNWNLRLEPLEPTWQFLALALLIW